MTEPISFGIQSGLVELAVEYYRRKNKDEMLTIKVGTILLRSDRLVNEA